MSGKVVDIRKASGAQSIKDDYGVEYTVAETSPQWHIMLSALRGQQKSGELIRMVAGAHGQVEQFITMNLPIGPSVRNSSDVPKGMKAQRSDSPMDSSGQDYRDKWLDERFARVEFSI